MKKSGKGLTSPKKLHNVATKRSAGKALTTGHNKTGKDAYKHAKARHGNIKGW